MTSTVLITALLSKQGCARMVQALAQARIPTSIPLHEAASSSRPCSSLGQLLQPMAPKQSTLSVLNGMLLSPQMQAAIDSLRHDSSLRTMTLFHSSNVDHGRLQLQSPEVTPIEEPSVQPTSSEAKDPAPLICGKRGTTYQPSRRKRVNSHGIEKRLSTFGGRNILMRRLLKQKRSRLTVDCFV